MDNDTWVCFDCRIAVRRPAHHRADVPCALCAALTTRLGDKVPVPQKRDERAWRALREQFFCAAAERATASSEQAVRTRHGIERRIRELESRPCDAERERLIGDLRKRLGENG